MGHSNAKPRLPWKHQNGQWCKKVNKRFIYLGSIDEISADEAARRWYALAPELRAGSGRPTPAEELTLVELVDRFLKTKRTKVNSGALTERSWLDYKGNCDRLVAFFGRDKLVVELRPDDFERLHNSVAKTSGPETLLSFVVRTRMVFKYALKNGLLEKPVLFGEAFEIPSSQQLRKMRSQRGTRQYSPEEVRKLIATAGVQTKAMLYLAINSAFGPADCGKLPISAIDLTLSWVKFPRPKTGVGRRCKLWPETADAIRQWLKVRPNPEKQELRELVFLRSRDTSWEQGLRYMAVADEFRRVAKKAGVENKGFYALRRTFRQIADEAMDNVACDEVMGHRDNTGMAGRYRDRDRISDERIERVLNQVRAWLLGPAIKKSRPARKGNSKRQRPAVEVKGKQQSLQLNFSKDQNNANERPEDGESAQSAQCY